MTIQDSGAKIQQNHMMGWIELQIFVSWSFGFVAKQKIVKNYFRAKFDLGNICQQLWIFDVVFAWKSRIGNAETNRIVHLLHIFRALFVRTLILKLRENCRQNSLQISKDLQICKRQIFQLKTQYFVTNEKLGFVKVSIMKASTRCIWKSYLYSSIK